ncbi:hypothetical protein [Liquorilactobacillus nagelii]|uniref:hypothetical protein n=1 Tax=Liquorilactobacillus nagelii TaxID=82688 RepID=UPI0006EF6F7A|nr:hypothetical protein [Liquorilactobacillus nagelii]KRL41800.1 hypothetical protein FD45_GL000652 [Liquorilactobacillus nagelii DSM 13675]QYH55277.1 hypothetical protein G6O73_11785 [Liquorilactobacillus nagelii DSM 13675]
MNFFKKFSHQEVTSFLRLTQDENPLHQQKLIVIPGNLLLLTLESKYQQYFKKIPTNATIKFCHPAYLNDYLLFETSINFFQIKNIQQSVIAKGSWAK